MYVDGCNSGAAKGYMPNGTAGDPGAARSERKDSSESGAPRPQHPGHPGLPPHFASIFVEPDALQSDAWFAGAKFDRRVTFADEKGQEVTKHVWEFRIPLPSKTVTFPDAEDAPAKCVGFADLPKILDIDKKFVFDLVTPDTIVRVPIRGGRLTPFRDDTPSAIQWTIRKLPKDLTITAEDDEGSRGTITLNALGGDFGTEIVLGNTPEFLSGVRHGGHQHFQLYGKLELHRDGSRLVDPPESKLDPLPHNHAYLKHLDHHHVMDEPGCGPGCC
ncbi:MAG TPA: hypothetical protein VN605_10260 [Thermoanaerobaculia bacterium]|nr:hypothetical protein [Thermoanaerobaculia bacterium]